MRIAGKRLCEDARLRAFAAVGGLRPGIHAGYPWTNATARGPFTGLLAGAKHGAPASGPPIWERGWHARNDQCGQDARAPQRKRPEHRPRIWEGGRPARNDQCGQDARAPQGKRPERRPQIPERGRLARHDQCGQDARAPQRKRPEHRPRIWEGGRPARKSLRQREAP